MLLNIKTIVANNIQLLGVFGLYLIGVFVFAFTYHRIYLRSEQSFSFNIDVLKNQISLVKIDLENKLANLTIYRNALVEFVKCLNANKFITEEMTEERKIVQTDNFCFHYTVTATHNPVGYDEVSSILDVYDLKGDRAHRGGETFLGGDITDFPEGFGGTIKNLLTEKGLEIVECRRRLGTLVTPRAEVWSFWDFLYFSIITQSTVGYGDILPNRTLIRIFVSVQILWGLVLLVVVINLVLRI